MSILFADVRGYTTIAERMSSVETTALLRRFYQAASKALLANDAILGQIAGDEVMAIFVPGLAGQGFPRRAVRAAEALLRAVGYGTGDGNWLDVGVGICTGEEYVGNVGGGGFKDFTAIGDITNTAARFQAAAGGGKSSSARPPIGPSRRPTRRRRPGRSSSKASRRRSRASASVSADTSPVVPTQGAMASPARLPIRIGGGDRLICSIWRRPRPRYAGIGVLHSASAAEVLRQ